MLPSGAWARAALAQLGIHPFAHTREAAMVLRANVLYRLGFPKSVADEFMRLTEHPGVHIDLRGEVEHFSFMAWEGGRIERNVSTRLIRGVTDAEVWTVTREGASYRLVLPAACRNWASLLPGPERCFRFRVGYDGYPVVVYVWWDSLDGAVVAERDAFLARLTHSPCFAPRKRECGCEYFDSYPSTLPRVRAADFVFTIEAGHDRAVAFPDFAAVHHAVYCPKDGIEGTKAYVVPRVTREAMAAGKWEYPVRIETGIPSE